jgi:hypothetical protein
MKGNGNASSGDDCFARFDEAFSKLEAELSAADAPQNATAASVPLDLSEYEEAFTNIDRQLAAHAPSEPAVAPEAPPPAVAVTPRPNLALVAPPLAAPTEPARPVPERTVDSDELWRRPAGGGTPLERLVTTIQNLLWLQRVVHSRSARLAERIRLQQVAELFGDARQMCVEFDLQTARVRADFAIASLDEDRLDRLVTDIGELVRHIRHDLRSCTISPVPRSRAWVIDASLDARTAKAFPSAAADVAAGGTCAGFGLQAAAVFHMLRAAEHGRRRLAIALHATAFDAGATDWGTTITALEHRLADAVRWSGPAKTAATGFYHALANDARLLHDAQRKLNAGDGFDEHHALAVLQTARAFLDRLAQFVSESQQRPLTQTDFTREV